jgi:hypothetical protein
MTLAVALTLFLTLKPLGMQPFARCRKWIRNEGCLSEASFLHFPFFAARKREPRRGKSAVAFLLLTFLWRSKEK